MRLWWLLLLPTFALISGCSADTRNPPPQNSPSAQSSSALAVPTSRATSPGVSSPSLMANHNEGISPSDAPGLRDKLAGGAWCKTGLPWAEREKALMAGLPTILGNQTASQIDQELTVESASSTGPGSAPCLRVEAVPDRDTLLISTAILHGGGVVLAAHGGGSWQLTTVEPPAPDWGTMEVLNYGVARPGDQGPDFIFVGGISGSSGYKGLFWGRPSSSGVMKLTNVSQVFWKTNFRFLGTDDVIATQLAEELGPVFETCNSCQPTRQSLLKWSGDTFVEVGSRTLSTPYLAANLFLGAIKAGDSGKALTYAANRFVVEKAQTWADQQNRLDNSACRNIGEIESSNWDLIPAEFRKALPLSLSTCSIKFGDAVMLNMRRAPGGWVVADITS
jgi:hypothetical protein